ncbi:MAG: PepSY domain-containing protein, partial [Acutalibacteraceae bacterium]
DELKNLSEQYGITVGKATLIKHLIDSEKTAFTFSQLAALSVNELNVLMSEQSIDNGISVTGSASRKAYIGEAAAQRIAYAAANVKKEQVTKTECKLDLDDGVLAYEVEFEVGGLEYECDINALTGEVLTCKSEKDDRDEKEEGGTTVPDTVVFKTKEEVKESILTNNGLMASDCRNFEIELDYEDGVAKYEVEFICGDTEYEYEVNAVSGKIISCSYKKAVASLQPSAAESQSTQEKTTTVTSFAPASETTAPTLTEDKSTDEKTTESKQAVIGAEKAERIASEHAGVNTEKAHVSVKLKADDDTNEMIYKVEMEYGGYEYEYEINAYTGTVIDFEKEKDD